MTTKNSEDSGIRESSHSWSYVINAYCAINIHMCQVDLSRNFISNQEGNSILNVYSGPFIVDPEYQ
jgi:hypothetical protein